jgi:formylglycine-generating enzyme required for sulfatase activity/serine/threonine protein kinase
MSNPDLPESNRLCPNCGAAIAADDVNGLCAACLMAAVARSTLPGSGTPKKSWEPPSAEELGRLLPQYRIERLLGRGGMGAVYQGRQVSLDRVVAIKILSNDLEAADASFAERFKNEARAMARMSHPGIVAVHDFGETANGLLYIVMEFIEGTDVAKMIAKQGRLHSEHAMAITAHVCDALAYAHERGIIHRDIKPANIMVGYDGVVKVADFGLAKVSASGGETLGLTQSGMAMGTLHFMAPEALMLGSAVDHRADIYAVGVMLYQMLTGKLPHGMFELPSIRVQGLDPRYDGIIARAMREDRDLRYQSAREMRHDLDGILTQPVQRVEPEAAQSIPAALPTEVRPRRSLAGQPYRPPQHSAPLPVQKKSSAGLVLLTLGMLAAIGAAMFFLGGQRSAPSGMTAPNESGQTASTASTTSSPVDATKDKPFVNTLGMKFVPVPGTQVLFSIWETRVQDYQFYAQFNKADERWKTAELNGVPVNREPDHPISFVNIKDAQTFCQWLTQKEAAEGKLPTGMKYRLPTDEEWSQAVGLGAEEGSSPAEKHEKNFVQFPWGGDFPPRGKAGNYPDVTFHEKFPDVKLPWISEYTDGFATTAPVGSFDPNRYGIYDLGGNVWELCEYITDSGGAEALRRGAGWRDNHGPVRNRLLSSSRFTGPAMGHGVDEGFRCVLAPATPSPISPSLSISSSATASATKEAPFVNRLGMKFVPVPGTNILMCIHETRRQDYAAYAAEVQGVDKKWKNFTRDGIPVSDKDGHPVVATSWEDAQAFCAWLSQKEGKTYRLPTDREWSYAVGIGDKEVWTKDASPKQLSGSVKNEYPWGSQWPPPNGVENYADTAWHDQFASKDFLEGYTDGFLTTAPVMSLKPNKFGIYDLGGNVTEWVEDWLSTDRKDKVLRGGEFDLGAKGNFLSSNRHGLSPAGRVGAVTTALGFRCVVELPEAASGSASAVPSPSSSSSSATKDTPFTNTLGMKFVPVPGTKVLMCIHETRRQDYAAYAVQTPAVDGQWKNTTEEGIPVSDKDDHPVVSVNWEDVQAFCGWLSKKEGKVYRLPTDQEWSFAVGIGNDEIRTAETTPEMLNGKVAVFPWGTGLPPPKGAGNYADITLNQTTGNHRFIPDYTDGFATTAPVMSFAPNKLGLYDLGGNVWEWVEDWWNGAQKQRVCRGASFGPHGAQVYSSARYPSWPHLRRSMFGFRLVTEVPGTDSTSAVPGKNQPLNASVSQTASATKDAPFVNTLGMKFVPVPITGGPTDGQRVLFSIWETRVQDYEAFVKETGVAWRKPDWPHDPTHPVTFMTRGNASAFCIWLTECERKVGKIGAAEAYRLPSDHEWSCAAGIGGKEDAAKRPHEKNSKLPGVFPWDGGWPPPSGAGNFAGQELAPELAKGRTVHRSLLVEGLLPGFQDAYVDTAPAGSFTPNQFGLFDLGGNAIEWCADLFGDRSEEGVLRGGSWLYVRSDLINSSARTHTSPEMNFYGTAGFRPILAPVAASDVKAVGAAAAASGPAVMNPPSAALVGPNGLSGATNDKPFTNTLGMKFVPVPGTNILMCIHETRRQDYRVYAEAVPGTEATWKTPVVDGRPLMQGEDHPVVHVSWEDAIAFCKWLGNKDGHNYRLPSDHEWNLAVAIGLENPHEISPDELHTRIKDAYPWPTPALAGNQLRSNQNKEAHYAAQTEGFKHGNYRGNTDGYEGTAPVMSFLPNHLGIYDLGGNVWEWCTAPPNASGNTQPLRGCGFRNYSWGIVADSRTHINRDARIAPQPDGSLRDFGFRCVVELPTP